ncbi:MAG: carboxymuconolactone decarboxylase family protein [Pseudomonadales bacterium]
MGSSEGHADEKILALDGWEQSEHFNEREKAALAYADAITLSDRDVDDALFASVTAHFGPDEIVELTAAIAWENASSKFNRALRVTSQKLWAGTANDPYSPEAPP